MTTVIIDRKHGYIFIANEPPIDVEFQELPLGNTLVDVKEEPVTPPVPEPAPIEEQTSLDLTQQPARGYHYHTYEQPDTTRLAQHAYITAEHVARILGMGVSTVRHLAAQGILKAYRAPRSNLLLFLVEEVVTYLKSKS